MSAGDPPIPNYNSSTTQGYLCPACGQWYPAMMTHICHTWNPNPYPPQQYYLPQIATPSDKELMEKLVSLLERVEKLLEAKE